MRETIISSSALILIVVTLRYLLRGRIRLRLQYALWALVALRLLLPFSMLPSPVSVMNAVSAVGAPAAVSAIPSPDAPAAAPSTAAAGTLTAQPEADAPTTEIPLQTPVSQPEALSVTQVLRIIWLCGAGLAIIWMAVTNLRFRRMLRRCSTPLTDADSKLPVSVAPGLPSPCLFGVFSPRIYLTPDCLASQQEKRFIITHEETHHAHKDYLWAYVRCLCLALYWFNPLVWLAAALSRRDGELACDEGTIARLGEDSRLPYGRLLVAMMSGGKGPSALVCSATTMSSGRGGIRERIRLIAQKPKLAIPALVLVILITAAAVGCTFTGAQSTASADSGAPSTEADATASTSPAGAGASTADPLDAPAVKEIALDYIKKVSEDFQSGSDWAAQHPVKITDYKLTALTYLARFDAMTDYPIELWQLEYRLKPDNMDNVMFAGGMSEENGWITDMGSTGHPCLIIGYKDGKAFFLGITNTLGIMEEGGAENAVRIYMERTGLLSGETYPGSHMTVRFEMSDQKVYRLILSQPVRQGDGGIWCVERLIYPHGGLQLVSPNREGLAMDVYKQQQADLDSGKNLDFSDPAKVALGYINGTLGQNVTANRLEITPGVADISSANLDQAIYNAVVENNRRIDAVGFRTENHTVLKVVEENGTYTVYVVAFYGEYDNVSGKPKLVRSVQAPMRLNFSNPGGAHVYALTNYTDFIKGVNDTFLRDVFPADIPDSALDTANYPDQEKECQKNAAAYFKG